MELQCTQVSENVIIVDAIPHLKLLRSNFDKGLCKTVVAKGVLTAIDGTPAGDVKCTIKEQGGSVDINNKNYSDYKIMEDHGLIKTVDICKDGVSHIVISEITEKGYSILNNHDINFNFKLVWWGLAVSIISLLASIISLFATIIPYLYK